MSSCEKSETVEAPLAAEGGVELPQPVLQDPYLALDDLMAVVEVLCPVWPERDVLVDRARMPM